MSETIEGLKELVDEINEFKKRSVSSDIVNENFTGVIGCILKEAQFPPYMTYEAKRGNSEIIIISFSMYEEFTIDVVFTLKHHCILVSSFYVERDFTNFDSSDLMLFLHEANSRKRQDFIDLSVEEIPFQGLEGIRVAFAAKLSCYSRLLFDEIEYAIRMIVEYQYHTCFAKNLNHPGLFIDEDND